MIEIKIKPSYKLRVIKTREQLDDALDELYNLISHKDSEPIDGHYFELIEALVKLYFIEHPEEKTT